MCGTDLAFGAIPLRVCCAMCGTDLASAAVTRRRCRLCLRRQMKRRMLSYSSTELRDGATLCDGIRSNELRYGATKSGDGEGTGEQTGRALSQRISQQPQ
eukprot:503700-Rhodomonas_salina.2